MLSSLLSFPVCGTWATHVEGVKSLSSFVCVSSTGGGAEKQNTSLSHLRHLHALGCLRSHSRYGAVCLSVCLSMCLSICPSICRFGCSVVWFFFVVVFCFCFFVYIKLPCSLSQAVDACSCIWEPAEYTFMHTCTHTPMHAHAYMHTHVRMHTHTHREHMLSTHTLFFLFFFFSKSHAAWTQWFCLRAENRAV